VARSKEFGFPDEEKGVAVGSMDGIGLAIVERAGNQRLVIARFTDQAGMVFALETFWPASDGWSAARIEEEIVITETAHEVISASAKNFLWPARPM